MIRLRYNAFDTDMAIQMMQSKKKANRKTEIIANLLPIYALRAISLT